MTSLQYIYLYVLTLPVFFLIDMLWLGVIARDFYRTQLGELMGDIRWIPALIFYALFVAALIFFAVVPALERGALTNALLLGALFGFVAYATYNLTNLATLRDWPLLMALVDMAWGAVLGALVAGASYLIAQNFLI